MKPCVPAGETFFNYRTPKKCGTKHKWLTTYKEIPISGGFYTRYYLYRVKSDGSLKCVEERDGAPFFETNTK